MNKNEPLSQSFITKKKDVENRDTRTKNPQKNLNNRLGRSLNNIVKRSYQSLGTGHLELNSLLKTDETVDEKNGGWPLGTTTEIGLTEPGIGELRLFIPALQALIKKSPTQPNIVLINPPYVPYGPALQKAQINPDYLTIINTNNKADILWAAEQTLSAKCCAAVLTWTNAHTLNPKEARRLQLATEKSGTLHVLFRHKRCLEQSSPFRLRINLEPHTDSKLELNIIKQPLTWGGQQCVLSLAPHYEHWQRIHVAALPVSQHFDQAKLARVKVLAKAKQANKVVSITSKQLMLPKVS